MAPVLEPTADGSEAVGDAPEASEAAGSGHSGGRRRFQAGLPFLSAHSPAKIEGFNCQFLNPWGVKIRVNFLMGRFPNWQV